MLRPVVLLALVTGSACGADEESCVDADTTAGLTSGAGCDYKMELLGRSDGAVRAELRFDSRDVFVESMFFLVRVNDTPAAETCLRNLPWNNDEGQEIVIICASLSVQIDDVTLECRHGMWPQLISDREIHNLDLVRGLDPQRNPDYMVTVDMLDDVDPSRVRITPLGASEGCTP